MKKLIYSLAFVLIAHCSLNIDNCEAQWVQTNGPHGTTGVNVVCGNGNDIYAGTGSSGSSSNFGLYKSTNNGLKWIRIGLDGNDINTIEIDINNSMIYVAVGGYGIYERGIYKKSLNGNDWTFAGMFNHYVRSIAFSGNNIFAGSDSGIYRSTNGLNWERVSLTITYVTSIKVYGSNIFVGANNGIFLSSDNGNTWTQKLTASNSYGI